MFLIVGKYHGLTHEKAYCHLHGNSSHSQIINKPKVSGDPANRPLEINIYL